MFSCSAIRTLYCKQMISSSTFKSQQTNKSYKIFHEVNCSSAYVIYLTECTLCEKQYVRKPETSFSIRLSNLFKKPDAISACRHFQERNCIFNKHTEFIIIDQPVNTTKKKGILHRWLIEQKKTGNGRITRNESRA